MQQMRNTSDNEKVRKQSYSSDDIANYNPNSGAVNTVKVDDAFNKGNFVNVYNYYDLSKSGPSQSKRLDGEMEAEDDTDFETEIGNDLKIEYLVKCCQFDWQTLDFDPGAPGVSTTEVGLAQLSQTNMTSPSCYIPAYSNERVDNQPRMMQE